MHIVAGHEFTGLNYTVNFPAELQQKKGFTEEQMFEHAKGDKDFVWTKASQAAVAIRSTMSFIGLIGFGTCSLAAAAMLVAEYIRSAP